MYCSHTLSVRCIFFQATETVLTMRDIHRPAENSNCLSSIGFGPCLTTLTKLSKIFPATLRRTSVNRRCHFLHRPQIVEKRKLDVKFMSGTEQAGPLTTCRGIVFSVWQKRPVRREGGRAGLPHGQVATWNGDDSSHPCWKCAQVTSKPVKTVRWAAVHPGEDRRFQGVVTHSRPVASDQPLIRGGDRSRRRLWVRCRLGHLPVELLRTETAQCSQGCARAGKSCGSRSSVAVRDRGH